MSVQGTQTQLEVWSDVACPWCYLGRRNLKVMLEDLEEHEMPVITWRAFQLDPSIPNDGLDSEAYFARKFSDLDAFADSRKRLEAMGEEVGIKFRFDRQRIIANTHLAHRIITASKEHGVQEDVIEAIFRANFELGIDIGNAQLLQELLVEELDDEVLVQKIMTRSGDDAVRASVDEDIATAKDLGISGVPAFVANRKVVVPGAVPAPVLRQFLEEVNDA